MKISRKVIFILVITLAMGMFSMPQNWKQKLPETFGIRNFFLSQDLHLGLDLQGGTQLDYVLDLRQANEYNNDENPENDVNLVQIIEGVRTTIERRVNGLGVSEPNIYTANVGDEYHIVVELAGINDIDEAKAIVGKTIQLEFKEQKEAIDPDEKEKIKEKAKETLEKAKEGIEDFSILGEKLKTGGAKITYEKISQFKDETKEGIKEQVWGLKEGEIYPELLEANEGYFVNEFQQVHEKTGFVILKAGAKEVIEREKTVDGEKFEDVAKEISENYEDKEVTIDFYPPELRTKIETLTKEETSDIIELDDKYIVVKLIDKKEFEPEVKASHILVSYKGAERSTSEITKLEAKKKAEEALKMTKEEFADFSALAKEYSDDPSASTGGDLGFFGKGAMTPKFEEAVFALEKNQISGIVETPFGFHIIKKTDEKEAEETKYTTHKISILKKEENAKEKIEKLRSRTLPKQVKGEEEKLTYEKIFYSTEPDPWKATGLDGSKFVRAAVSFDQFGKPLVVIEFNSEGGALFSELTERNIGKPIAIFVGVQLISAPTVNEKIPSGSAQITGKYTIPEAAELAQDLNTGAISAPIILVGQNKIGAMLGVDAFNKSIIAGFIGVIVVILFMIFQYGLLGLVADIALLIYIIILVFILKTSGAIGIPIVLSLAGIAGIILSIGMAVDANILIFERIKEELKEGKKYTAAISIGFERAWLSIRDSNISSLITCGILAWFGSSIIRGFAINLAIGILVSMFTAITIARSILHFFFSNWDIEGKALSKINKK